MRSNRPYVQIDPDVLEWARQIDLLSKVYVTLTAHYEKTVEEKAKTIKVIYKFRKKCYVILYVVFN